VAIEPPHGARLGEYLVQTAELGAAAGHLSDTAEFHDRPGYNREKVAGSFETYLLLDSGSCVRQKADQTA
jgi:hypothetical protein